jgi:multidrug efflux pump subunit AcrA (membrane-fusion protein)
MRNILGNISQLSVALTVFFFGLLCAAWFFFSQPHALPKSIEERIFHVETLRLESQDVQPLIKAFGSVRASRVAEIRPMVSGRVFFLSEKFQNGYFVKKGARLVGVDSSDFESALSDRKAELVRDEAFFRELMGELVWERRLRVGAEHQVELADQERIRSRELLTQGLLSNKAFDDGDSQFLKIEQARMQHDQTISRLEFRLEQQSAEVAMAKTAVVDAERDLADTNIYAPFSGHISGVALGIGQRVSIGEGIGRLISSAELEVMFDLPESDFSRILNDPYTGGNLPTESLVGKPLKVLWRLGGVVRTFRAELLRIGPEIDPSVGGIQIYAELEPGAHLQGIRSGAFVEVEMADQVYKNIFRIPVSALSNDDRLYLIVDGRLKAFETEVLRIVDGDMLVRATLPADAVVVSKVFPKIGEGLKAETL